MKTKVTFSIFFLMLISMLSFEIPSSDGKAGYTNSPGEGNCTSCHSGTINSGPGSIEINTNPSVAEGYVPGTDYTITVSVQNNQSPNNKKFGFAFEALLEDGSNAGTLSVTNSGLTSIETVKINGKDRDNMIHTGQNNTGPNTQNFVFNWKAPESGDKTVKFYAVGNAANNNGGTSGDNIYSTVLEVQAKTTTVFAEDLKKSINVYPNPSNGIFQIEVVDQDFHPADMVVINSNGSIIYHATLRQSIEQINLNTSPKGNYFIRLSGENRTFTKKISIQ